MSRIRSRMGSAALGLLALVTAAAADDGRFAAGERLYREGVLPDGRPLTGILQGEVPVSGRQAVCSTCHRHSAMGSVEGDEVVPALRGNILFSPLRLPTSKPPAPPELRPAYTVESLRRAIREGIDVGGKTLSPVMPRYAMTDGEIDLLVDYFKGLNSAPDPGVTAKEIHLATVVSDALPADQRKALLDVFVAYVQQKNSETRNESIRAEHAPWHEAWMLESYRKWVLHVWELKGDRAGWPAQLADYERQQPVFALIGGAITGPWQPIHEFCQNRSLPCLFPSTALPVINEEDFYALYLDKGMVLEGQLAARHILEEAAGPLPVIQVYRAGDPYGTTAAAALQQRLQAAGITPTDIVLEDASRGAAPRPSLPQGGKGASLVLWLNADDVASWWSEPHAGITAKRIYLSAALAEAALDAIPAALSERVRYILTQEPPARAASLLTRSTFWLRSKRIHSAQAPRLQADAYLALTLTGMALNRIRGYFLRDYFLEGFEHLVDNAPYKSVYPRIGLAPGQRFISKGGYIARLAGKDGTELTPVGQWLIP